MPTPLVPQIFASVPKLAPGQKVIRLKPSTTGRAIPPGIQGIIGGLNPGLHDNHPEDWLSYGYVPIQWTNGLWSNMEIDARKESWNFFPVPVEAPEEDEED